MLYPLQLQKKKYLPLRDPVANCFPLEFGINCLLVRFCQVRLSRGVDSSIVRGLGRMSESDVWAVVGLVY